MAFRETVTAKTFQLPEDTLRIFLCVPFASHTVDQLIFKVRDQTVHFERGHTSSQLICLSRRKTCSHNGDLHGLLLKQRYTKCASQDFFQLFRWINNWLFSIP